MSTADLHRVPRYGFPPLDHVPLGVHACHFYDGRDQLVAALVPYILDGLRNNERCLWVTAWPLSAHEAGEALRAAWSGAEDAIRAGGLRILDFDEWYASDRIGRGDFVRSCLEEEERALADGYNGLRVTGNTSLVAPGDWSAFMQCEQTASLRFEGRRIAALCSYAQGRCDDRQRSEAMRAHHRVLQHPHVIAGTVDGDAPAPCSGAATPRAGGDAVFRRPHRRPALFPPRHRPKHEGATPEDDRHRMAEEESRREIAGPEKRPDLRLLIDCAAHAFCAVDRDGTITLCNPAFLRMAGFQRDEEVLGRDFHRLIQHWRLDGSPYPRSDSPVLKAARDGAGAQRGEDLFCRADGTSFPVEYSASPIVRDGRIEGALCTYSDITERKHAEARQRLLNQELAHRMRNTLAVVQAIVSQTLRNTDKPKDAVRAIDQRLIALTNAHEVLMRRPSDGSPITEVVKHGVAVCGLNDARISADGPEIEVGPRTALALTMALHELCTNAIKYGALSGTGHVAVAWTSSGEAGAAMFHLRWTERGGPPVTAPERTGFGSRIICEYCRTELGGDVRLSFPPEGVEWTLDVPLRALER